MPRKKLLLDDIAEELYDDQEEVVGLDSLISIHERLKVAKKYEKIVGDAIINRMLNGETTPGYTLTRTKGKAKIVDNDGAVNKLIDHVRQTSEALPLTLQYGDVLNTKSISDLKKVLGEEKFDDLIGDFIEVAEEGDNYTYTKVEETNNKEE